MYIKTIFKFVCVGSIGFVIDVSIFLILIKTFEAANNLYLSSLFKAISFVFAVYVTYIGNYFFTFTNKITRRNTKSLFIKYLSGQLLGWATNFTSYILSINFTEVMIQRLILASFVGMFVNFILSNLILIRSK